MRDFWRALARNRLALVGGVIVAVLAILAVAAPVISPWDPNRPDVKKILNPPSNRHIFGTDQLGRDVLARMLYGARVSLAVGLRVGRHRGDDRNSPGLRRRLPRRPDRRERSCAWWT